MPNLAPVTPNLDFKGLNKPLFILDNDIVTLLEDGCIIIQYMDSDIVYKPMVVSPKDRPNTWARCLPYAEFEYDD